VPAMAQCRSVCRDRSQSPSKSVMHQHTRRLQTVKVFVTTCGLHFELKHSRLSDEAATRRLVWNVQALGFTAELIAGLHAREVADSKASTPRLDLIEIETLLEIVKSLPVLIYDGAISLITSRDHNTGTTCGFRASRKFPDA